MTEKQWDSDSLQALLAELRAFGDDTTLVECKKAAGGVPGSIGETVCAFANMPEGGTILLGVDEHAGFAVTGIADPAAMEKGVVDSCRQTVQPTPQLNFEHVILESKTVIVVEVVSLLPTEKPARYKGNPYLRQADGDYIMNSNDLRLLELAKVQASNAKFDFAEVEGTDRGQLDSATVNTFLDNVRRGSRRLKAVEDDERLLELMNVSTSDGALRLAGLYTMGFYPQSSFPALRITAAVRLPRGDSGARVRTKNLVHLDGPLPSLLEDALEWVAENSSTVTVYDERGNLRNQPEFPPSAVREAISNALVHRDLGPSLEDGKQVDIRLDENALIIASPGGLRGLTVGQLESNQLAKEAINQRVYSIAHYLETSDGARVVEGEGGGIREMFAALHEAGMAAPRLFDQGTQFTVKFPRGPRLAEKDRDWLDTFPGHFTPLQEDVLVGLRRGESYSLYRLQRQFPWYSDATLKRAMAELEERGVISTEQDVYALVDNSSASPRRGKSAAEMEPQWNREHPRSENAALDLHRLGKNAPAVYAAVRQNGPLTLQGIREDTGFSPSQIRYALKPLIQNGLVVVNGGQGTHGTTYRVPR